RRMASNLQLRHHMATAIRDFLDDEGFLEIETPVLIRSTPEGARDFLVPSRLKPGYVYALAQSPQLYKQLLMVAGVDRYFQIVRCYRDEDLRADRQPEFTQLDLEMSFVAEDDVLDIVQRCFAHIWQQALTEVARGEGAKGLAFWHREADGWRSPISKFFSERELTDLQQAFTAEPGDLVVAVADRVEVAAPALGGVRKAAARMLELIKEGVFEFVWVTEFPLFERSKETGEITAAHHPFTSPRPEDIGLLDNEPLKVRARAYDLVLNGTELGSGSIRIHDPEMQQRVFQGLGISRQDAERRFGFLLTAFGYGAP